MAGIPDYSTTAASNTAVGGINIQEGWAPSSVNNAIRALMADIATMTQGGAKVAEVTVASATTCNILGALSDFIAISGTTTITSLGTGANRLKFVRFTDALTLTHNSTSLILPGGANITTAAGDTMIVESDASSNVRVLAYQKADGTAIVTTSITSYLGKQSIWIPAGAMVPFVTNGAAAGLVELSTNKWPLATLDFDATTQEFAGFGIRMPKSWNESTVTFIPVWSHASTTTNFGVVWGLDAAAISNDDAGDASFGTAQTSADTGGTTNDIYQGPESSAITIAGSPAVGDWVQFRLHRDPSNASDTMAIDARLVGILLLYTIDALKDD